MIKQIDLNNGISSDIKTCDILEFEKYLIYKISEIEKEKKELELLLGSINNEIERRSLLLYGIDINHQTSSD